MGDRTFRFGVVMTPDGGPERWVGTARRAEELGYCSLLMPDGLQLLAPFPSLAMAAQATTNLRVATFVLASPLRPPLTAAWEGHTLSVLTDGRFEFGIGTGRPQAAAFAEQLGLPWGTPAQRLQQVADAIDDLRKLDGDRRTPVLMAAAGPKALDLAAEKADIVTLAATPLAPRADVVELAMNLFVVGDEVPPWVRAFMGTDAETLIAHDSLTMLRGETPAEMADELQRRRDTIGVSYVSVNGTFMEQFAPVLERLTGR
jgi:alkanesulfonate monooxygenase SsuD/methylene tetrahydromethanopterin reductase-like flavin-dependent oxidoreductase (luciferase family)